MRSRAALSLIEQVIMLLVFAFAAAVCLRAFVWSDSKSRQESIEDMAIIQLESVAETVKYYRGDLSVAAFALGGETQGQTLYIYYDEDWSVSALGGCYYLKAERLKGENPLLGQASLEITDSSGQLIAQLPVCWQEVSLDG